MAARGENATKARIRETATRLFREKSFEVVTLNEICKASGVNKHTFYYYFKSKDELLERYYDLPWHLSASEVTNILNADSYVDQLWLIMQKFVDYTKRMGIQILRQVLIKNLNQDVGTFRPDNAMKEMCKLQCSIIEKGQKVGQFRNRSCPLSLVLLLQQVSHSSALIWTVLGGDFDYAKQVRLLFETLLDVDEAYRVSQDYQKELLLQMIPREISETHALL